MTARWLTVDHPVHTITAERAQGAQSEHDQKGGHAEADHDGGEHQGLRQGIGQVLESVFDQGRTVEVQPATCEQKDVDGVTQQREPQYHGKGVGPQQQVNGTRRHDPDEDGDQGLHQTVSSRVVKRPMPARIRSTVPTTAMYTPRSKNMALASSNFPTNGRVT